MLRRLLAIHPGEGRTVFHLAAHDFLLLAATTVLLTAADALFVETYAASLLPWVYVGGALLGTAAALAYGRLRRRWPATRVHRTVVVGLSLFLVLLRLSEPLTGSVLPFVYLLVAPAYGALLSLERIRLLNASLDPRSARRALPAIGAVGGIGATAGALAVAAFADGLGTIEMFWLASVLTLATLVPARGLGHRTDEVRRTPPASWKALLRRPYARGLMTMVVLAAVLATLSKFQLGAATKEALAPEAIAPFYGRLYGLLNAVSIVFALVVGRAIIGRFGVGASLLVYPAVMALSGGLILAVPTLLVAAGMQVAERLLRQNLHRPARRIAAMPLPDPERVRFAISEEGLLIPGGTAITSFGILAVIGGLPWSAVGVIVLVAGLGLLFFSNRTRRRYTAELTAALHARRLHLDPTDALEPLRLDAHGRTLVERQLRSGLPENVALALRLLDGQWTAATLSAIAERWPTWPAWLRAAAVEVLADEDLPRIRAFLEGLGDAEPPEVEAALVAHGVRPLADVRPRVAAWAKSDDPSLHAAAARVLRAVDDAELRDLLPRLADAAPAVALEVAARLPDERHLDTILATLHDDEHVRLAQGALQALGAAAIPRLETVARDDDSAHAVAALGAMEDPSAAAALLRLLGAEDDELRLRAARALALRPRRLTAADRVALRRALDGEVERMRVSLDGRHVASDAILEAEWAADLESATQRVFLLLQVLDPGRPYRRFALALAGDDAEQRKMAIEALDELLDGEIAVALLPLLEGQRGEATEVAPGPGDGWHARLAAALGGDTEDERLSRALHLRRAPLFEGWAVRDLLLVVEEVERRASDEGDVERVGDVDVPHAAVYAALRRKPRCARAWLASLAARLEPETEGTPAVTNTRLLSLASRQPVDDARPVGDTDVWDRVFFLRTTPLAQGLSSERLLLLASIARPVSAAEGEYVMREGRLGHHFYLVCTGSLEVEVGGRRVAVLGPGDGAGELALLGGTRRMGSIRALEACELLTIERTDFLDLIDTHPSLVEPLSQTILRRTRAAPE